ncbi:CDP-diacylglycerol--glycerol-3-phosphate 3-phosphatidyltransferase [Vibrio breoganii]|uniref:CDP-diacylglycerol--glycerol-3-phosphate 3-phosphatidyltransferase n=1 Tax=Vibrio breoganii TaxID=553239 RepID=A0AAN0XUG4_9VIBR|nr:CDP-diacylglycerol--glycerol-3-phosphate 3-phosphatidyltransferase [Vibrio breoganii]ANO32746.1 CDP-diacylglycerol--glycerol-3-phosphate 3-phosphatidyltransferase [Vibrio breoganii]MDN3714793.1 CDP-diacylglycerol--glycerol-3-phosphate 3-phosphatidyltransferase [Vibrio breoganii]OED95730.1 CDP-diacylglycerol--glycerol-3-phosphate 3-phosphatidyltransferase [Vibrio breoganii ZF-55]PMG76680.1 CDP-diacylglycerol--glycerol-3-phosphate 3-phosphatidyltransferase [Vibrio breoganii]PMK26968.1 CDP-dia
MRLTIPNILTMIRLFLIPVFVIVFYLPTTWAPFTAAMVFWVAGFTDWLDGLAARKLGQTSRFGAFLDPVADKVMVATALLLIAEHFNTIWITVPAIIMISREIIISALREWMAEIGKRSSVAVSWVGKVKTFSQMFALWVLIWRYDDWMVWIGYLSLYVATVLTLWSMVQYLMAAKDDLLNSEE